jgi:hypothetical protein
VGQDRRYELNSLNLRAGVRHLPVIALSGSNILGLNMIFLCRLPLLILIALAVPFNAAQAHNLNVFAMSNGDTIEGYVYFTGGTRAQMAQIELRDAAERLLFSTTTDHEGSFEFTVSHRSDYTVFTNTGDGHIATFDLYANEFAEHLPLASENATIIVQNVNTATGPSTPETIDPDATDRASHEDEQSSHFPVPVSGTLSDDELATLINRAVASQIGPLREEINAYRTEVRMSDVLGGIGMILGIFGISAWLMARRQTRN